MEESEDINVLDFGVQFSGTSIKMAECVKIEGDFDERKAYKFGPFIFGVT